MDIDDLFEAVADIYPEEYARIMKELKGAQLGRHRTATREETRAAAKAFRVRFGNLKVCKEGGCNNDSDAYEFYDGRCALCEAERRRAEKLNKIIEARQKAVIQHKGAFS